MSLDEVQQGKGGDIEVWNGGKKESIWLNQEVQHSNDQCSEKYRDNGGEEIEEREPPE